MIASCKHLRVVETSALNAYLERRKLKAFKRANAQDEGDAFGGEFVLYHSWKPGFLELAAKWREALAEIRRHDAEVATLSGLGQELVAFVEGKLGWADDGSEPDLDLLVARTKSEFVALQNPVELRRFLEIVRTKKPKVVVEIGTAAGGMLYAMAQVADENAIVVSIDYPGGPYGGGQSSAEVGVYRSFGGPRQRMGFIRDRSFHLTSLTDLKKILGGAPIDLLFVDGDHSYGGVRSDFDMYGPLVAPGGMTAFHDIVLEPEAWGRGADAGAAWRSLREGRRTEEIFDPNGLDGPPPERPKTFEEQARYKWGIGIIHH